MSCSMYYYVVIPKNFDVEKHLSLSELAGINIKVEEVKRTINNIQKSGGAHCQDEDYEDRGWEFVVRFLTELRYVLFTEERGFAGDDQIISIKEHLLNKKQLVEQILKES